MAKRVLIVDDSALVRKQIGQLVETLDFEVEFAKNGQEGVDKAVEENFDVITMDINMPVLDGLSAVKLIMEKNPTPILMVSSLTSDNATTTMEALDLGAIDYITKPGTMNVGKRENSEDILEKVSELSRIPKRKMKRMRPVRLPVRQRAPRRERTTRELTQKSESRAERAPRERRRETEPKDTLHVGSSQDITKIVLVGVSTGGPGLVECICASLPEDYPHPVCFVQHMPEQFTEAFAERLDRVSALEVHHSKTNMEVLPGNVYVARGGVHMHFTKKVSGKIVIRDEKDDNNQFFKPSVDEMFDSALKIFEGKQILGVILTGIGDDGAAGLLKIREAGGYTLGESEDSCTVYGMPKVAFDIGAVMEQLPFAQIAKKISTFR
ncbi:MAG: chemotaxis-specific protein-glutamate methyltransferase CheB [Campylobacterota bacterium]|nr:chemotaxis-specific protein-glutamate methyltransferase CheB [Campylobacterota bacterium]